MEIFNESIYCSPDPCVEYHCHNNIKSAGFTLLMKLTLLTREYRETESYIKNYIKKNIKYHGEGINKQNDKGWTPLMLAVANLNKFSTENSIKILLEAKANVNIKNNNGMTALMLASNNGYDARNIIKMLLDAGADPNIQDIHGSTVLMHLITNNKPFIERSVNALLESSVNVNVRDKSGNTAIMMAVGYNYESVVELLLDKKADLNIVNNNKENAVSLYLTSIKSLNEKLLVKMLDTYNPNTKDMHGDVLLTTAIKKNNNIDMDNIVKRLINTTNLSSTNNMGNTILHNILEFCKVKNKIELVNMILQKDNININSINNNGDTPITVCVKHNKGNIVLFIILCNKGAVINCENNKKSVIRYIIENDDIPLAKLYIEKGGELSYKLFKYTSGGMEEFLKPYIIKYEYYKLMHKNMIMGIKNYIQKHKQNDDKVINLSDMIKTNYLSV